MIFAATSFSKMFFFGQQMQSVKLALLSSFSLKSVLKSCFRVEGRLNCRNKTAFSNCSDVQCEQA